MSWPTVTPARWLRVLASGLLARAPEDDDELCLVVDLCEAGGHHDLVERAAHAVLQLGEQVRLGRQVAAALDGVLPVVERDAEAFGGRGTGAPRCTSSSTGQSAVSTDEATACNR